MPFPSSAQIKRGDSEHFPIRGCLHVFGIAEWSVLSFFSLVTDIWNGISNTYLSVQLCSFSPVIDLVWIFCSISVSLSVNTTDKTEKKLNHGLGFHFELVQFVLVFFGSTNMGYRIFGIFTFPYWPG